MATINKDIRRVFDEASLRSNSIQNIWTQRERARQQKHDRIALGFMVVFLFATALLTLV